MNQSIELKMPLGQKSSEGMATKVIEIKNDTKYAIILGFAIFVLLSSFLFNSPSEIFQGMGKIILATSVLVTDYMAIANIGAALFNSGILMIITIVIARANKVQMNGPIIAAVFTIGGFALFGKNIYNIWAIMLGVYFYGVLQKEKFSKFILMAFLVQL